MNSKKIILSAVTFIIMAAALWGCGNDSNEQATGPVGKKEIVVGVTPGANGEIMDFFKKEAEKQGLKIKVVEFSDYITPNEALNNGEIDINAFQHKPFMDNAIKEKGYKITAIGKTIIAPMALYSHKIKSLDEIKDGDKVAIPNDPTNGGRALLLLQSANLIKLKDNAGITPSVADIVDNPKHLQILELEAAQIPRSLEDMVFAAVNMNYALNAKLDPKKDAILVESKDSAYVNVLAVREADRDNPQLKKFVQLYQSEAVRNFILEQFKGSVIPVF
jgi:D-methionine transport system substrate-binding protein